MARRVGICAVAQTGFRRANTDQRFQGMALDVLESLRAQTGVDFAEKGITMIISNSDDVFDARTISDNAMTDVLGGHLRCEEKVAQESIQMLYYGMAAIQSGHNDIILLMAHCKESQGRSRNMATHVAFDPFFTRPLGMDFCAAAGLQARAYMQKSHVGEEHLARIVTRCRANSARNPNTQDLKPVTEKDVMYSPMLVDPIRELHAYPVSDGAVGMIIAAEERVKELTKTPVWITGAGNCMDSFFLGDRDIVSNFALKKAAERAFKRAGVTDPKGAFDIIEVSDQYAYQLPMWMEGLGFVADGDGGRWIDQDGPDSMRVNLSGGMLAGNPLLMGGITRAAEAVLQLTGKAGDRQVDGARRALAHGVMGPAGQFHSVITLERN